MENRGRTDNGTSNNNRSADPLSPTGTLGTDAKPLVGGGTPAEGQPGDGRPAERLPSFRRLSYVGGDAPVWGRTDHGGRPGFGSGEYGSDIDEREGWYEGADTGWRARQGQGSQQEGRRTWNEGGRAPWPADEQGEGRGSLGDRGRQRGGDLSFRNREPQGRERDQSQGQRSSWWQREKLTVSDVMTSNVKSVGTDATARDIADLMKHEDVGVIPVVRGDGRLLGLVTDRDLVIRGVASGRSPTDAKAEDLATTDIEVVAPRDPLSAVIELMGRQQIRRVPVVDDDDRLVGIVAMADIANRADYHEDLQQALEKISGRRSFWSRIWR